MTTTPETAPKTASKKSCADPAKLSTENCALAPTAKRPKMAMLREAVGRDMLMAVMIGRGQSRREVSIASWNHQQAS